MGCRAPGPISTRTRFVADDDSLILGAGQQGRGAWLCTSTLLDCFDRATSQRSWARALRTRVQPTSVEHLRAYLADLGQQR